MYVYAFHTVIEYYYYVCWLLSMYVLNSINVHVGYYQYKCWSLSVHVLNTINAFFENLSIYNMYIIISACVEYY